MKHAKQPKPLNELTLLDRFLFDEVMEDPDNMQILLEIILSKDVPLSENTQTEKEFRRSTETRQVKLDVWAIDENQNAYDAEVQKKNTGNLPKRSRLYQGMIDSKLLLPGVRDFNQLNPVYVILIAPFDLFGYGLYRYTFTNTCKEVPGLELGDGATRIFLNTRGTDSVGVSEELIELLHYMEHTNRPVSLLSSDRLNRLRDNVVRTQENADTGVKYMQAWEELAEARDEGREEGIKEGVSSLADAVLKLRKGLSADQLLAEGMQKEVVELAETLK